MPSVGRWCSPAFSVMIEHVRAPGRSQLDFKLSQNGCRILTPVLDMFYFSLTKLLGEFSVSDWIVSFGHFCFKLSAIHVVCLNLTVGIL